jgi:hypothetical protein
MSDLREALQRARGALADIARSNDMTLSIARRKAQRVYEETAALASAPPASLPPQGASALATSDPEGHRQAITDAQAEAAFTPLAELADAIDALDASLDNNVPYGRTIVYEAMQRVKNALHPLLAASHAPAPQEPAEFIYQIRDCDRSDDWKGPPGVDPNAWTCWREVTKATFDKYSTRPKFEGRVLALYASPAPGELGAVDVSAAESDLVPQVRRLLWGKHPECCGSPVEDTGAEYMGRVEIVFSCCGSPDYVRLNDAQIVASLRALLPESTLTQQAPSRRNQQENQMDTQSPEWLQLVELAAAHLDNEGDGPEWARLVAAIANEQAPSESSAQGGEKV